MLRLDEVYRAAEFLRAGRVVALPAETVYGLAADACCDHAVAEIFRLKNRPTHNPLIVHYACLEHALCDVIMPEFAVSLAKAFWPGPLTLVLRPRARSSLSHMVRGEQPSVAVRVPAHPAFQAVLRAFGGPLAAPSANPSGRISPTCAAHVTRHFPGLFVVDGGSAPLGLESTVIDGRALVQGTQRFVPDVLRVFRLGALSLDAIAACVRKSVVLGTHMPTQGTENHQVLVYRSRNDDSHSTVSPNASSSNGAATTDGQEVCSPGQLLAHYAPSKPVRLEADCAEDDEGVLDFGTHCVQGGCFRVNLSPSGDLQEAASRLFASLHELDDAPCARIAVAPVPTQGLGAVINDRLKRAAASSPKSPAP
jgi:L-threonylcarbamoyladenylate synthase